MKHLIILILAVFAAIPGFGQSILNNKADSIVGEYLVPDEKNGDSKVRFTKNQDGTFNCKVFWIKDNIDPKTGKPWIDYKNPDKSLRGQRCDNLVIVKGLCYNPEKKQWDGARIYDPNRGITAKIVCRFTQNGDLQMKGTVLGIGETQYWIRLK